MFKIINLKYMLKAYIDRNSACIKLTFNFLRMTILLNHLMKLMERVHSNELLCNMFKIFKKYLFEYSCIKTDS